MEEKQTTKQIDTTLQQNKLEMDDLDVESQNDTDPPQPQPSEEEPSNQPEQCHLEHNGTRIQLGSSKYDAHQLLGFALQGIDYLKKDKTTKPNSMCG